MTLMEEKKLSRHLPEVLKHEILWHSYSRLINRIPYFTDWPIELIEKLVIMEKQLIYLEHDLIADVGLPGEGLMIVYSGVLAVYTSQKVEVGHLIDGDYFGELSLVTDQEVRTSSFVAVSKCKVLLLEKIRFRQLMRSYPDLFYAMRDKIFEEYREV
ncbi:cyclic nucleotide-gated cation channel alpha-3-like [Amyelois transitella]|uniref:cyclic nucleotide-gated cation channel alpha-3-like n=1 Tax=Amyelois transitella TaxID=680683 RepID=UPI00299037DB|nr:cyclic nucleotide-gated cation channel alpha-3-like [Amyelois transitella]